MERFNLKKASELEFGKQYQIKVSNGFAALENVNDSGGINSAWENLKETIEISAKESVGLYEWKQHKPWFDEEFSQTLDQRRQVKMQWLWDPNRSNVDSLNSINYKASRHFRKKKKEYLTAEINVLEKLTVITRISETCIGASVTSRRVTSVELIQ